MNESYLRLAVDIVRVGGIGTLGVNNSTRSMFSMNGQPLVYEKKVFVWQCVCTYLITAAIKLAPFPWTYHKCRLEHFVSRYYYSGPYLCSVVLMQQKNDKTDLKRNDKAKKKKKKKLLWLQQCEVFFSYYYATPLLT